MVIFNSYVKLPEGNFSPESSTGWFFFRDFPTRSHIKSILRVESQNNEMNKEVVGGFKHDFYVPFHIWDVIICH